LFAKVSKLDWVKEINPSTPTRKNGWGKNATEYHLDKDFAIEIHANGELVHKWKWVDNKEANKKAVPKKYWDAFLTAATKSKLVASK